MALLFLLSQRFKISYPIFLVIGGLGISFIPQVPNISISPDLVFLIFLPPLLFDAAWKTSWNNFWKWRRSIFLLGFGFVFFTSLAIAHFSENFIPGFTLAMGFLLGGIISPPDAVAATAILKDVNMPRRGITILEGESLVNDAASLTVFSFALTAIKTGNFIAKDAIINFLVLSVMGVIVGLAIAHILYWVLKYWAKSSSITTPITLIAPYLMYIIAEEMHWSGVLAVVSGGLFLSFRSKDFLNFHARIQIKEVWGTIDFLLNGFVFILIGLELPVIMQGMEGEYKLDIAIKDALSIVAIIVGLRIVLVYLMEFLPRLINTSIRKNEKSPGWKFPFIIGWTGMRGVVSLAAALSIPLYLDDGSLFPHRNLIIFITFVVILATLVFQGLTLPLFIKFLKIEEIDDYVPEEVQVEEIRYLVNQHIVTYMNEHYKDAMEKYESVARIKEQYERSILATEKSRQELSAKEFVGSSRRLYKKVMWDIIEQRRRYLHKLEGGKKYEDYVIRDMEYSLDLEEARLMRQ